jgi:hypothetical protein
MTSSEIIKLRLFNQQLAEKKITKPHELVSWMGAMQAQDYAMAKWAIGLRIPDQMTQWSKMLLTKEKFSVLMC